MKNARNQRSFVMRTRAHTHTGATATTLVPSPIHVELANIIALAKTNESRRQLDLYIVSKCPLAIFMKPPPGDHNLMFGSHYAGDNTPNTITDSSFECVYTQSEINLIAKMLINLASGASIYDTDGVKITKPTNGLMSISKNAAVVIQGSTDYIKSVTGQLKKTIKALTPSHDNVRNTCTSMLNTARGKDLYMSDIIIYINPRDQVPGIGTIVPVCPLAESVRFNNGSLAVSYPYNRRSQPTNETVKQDFMNAIDTWDSVKPIFIEGSSGTVHLVQDTRWTPNGSINITGNKSTELYNSHEFGMFKGQINVQVIVGTINDSPNINPYRFNRNAEKTVSPSWGSPFVIHPFAIVENTDKDENTEIKGEDRSAWGQYFDHNVSSGNDSPNISVCVNLEPSV